MFIRRPLLGTPDNPRPTLTSTSSSTSAPSSPSTPTPSSTNPLPSHTTSQTQSDPTSESKSSLATQTPLMSSHPVSTSSHRHLRPTTQTRATASSLSTSTHSLSTTRASTSLLSIYAPSQSTTSLTSNILQSTLTTPGQPSPTSNLLNSQPSSNDSLDSTSKISSTTIAAIGVVFGFIVIMFCLLLRKRLREDKEKAKRRRQGMMETKESSFFGGSDNGDSEKAIPDTKAVESSPSWVSGFMDQLHLPPAPVAPRWSRRGSGWEALPSAGTSPVVDSGGFLPTFNLNGPQNHPHLLPHVHFVDDSRIHGAQAQYLQKPKSYHGYTSESDYRDSDCFSMESDVVIATAARATIQSYIAASPRHISGSGTPDTVSHGASSLHGPSSSSGIFASAGQSQREMPPPHLTVINPSSSNTSDFSSSSYGRDSDTSRYMMSTPHESGGDVSDAWVTSDEATSVAILARARQPLRLTSKEKRHQSLIYSPGGDSRIPARGNHDDVTIYETRLRRSNTTNDRYSTKADVGWKGRQSTSTYATQHGPLSPRLSMGVVMLTNYGERGSIVPPILETPSIDHTDEWEMGSRRELGDNDDEYEDVVPHSPVRSPRFSVPRGPPPQLPLPPPPRALFATPRLTVTSPSNPRLSDYDISESSSAEGAFIGLSQMAMMKSQPHYRSPTYSMYHMYDGDDEGGRKENLRLSFRVASHNR